MQIALHYTFLDRYQDLLVQLMGTEHTEATEASLTAELNKLTKKREASVNNEAKLVDDHYSGKIGNDVYNKLLSLVKICYLF